MKNLFFALCLIGFLQTAKAQIFYYTNFNAWPDSWSVTAPAGNISQSSLFPSNFSQSPPPASGGFNVLFCNQNSGLTTLISPSISTINRTNLLVAFGVRKDKNWNDAVPLAYSVNNGAWNVISNDVSGPNDTWVLQAYNVPPDANNKANVRFRLECTLGNGNCGRTFQIDDFSLGSNLSLPVELTYFEAKPLPDSRAVALRWSTSTETNNAFFDVERSADEGRRYETIGTIPGAGTTTLPQAYEFIDQTAPCGTPLYRLRQVDTDQKDTYSPAQAVYIRCNGARIQPTRATDRLYLRWAPEMNLTGARWQFLNSAGQITGEGAIEDSLTGAAELPTESLPAGVYWLRLQTDRLVEILPFFK